MEGFNQGSDIICPFLKFQEWIKGRSVESGGPVRGSRKVIIIIAQALTRMLVVERGKWMLRDASWRQSCQD